MNIGIVCYPTFGGVNTTNGGILINNMWQFSVHDKSVADSLLKLEGKDINVHYMEKMHALPWRGDSRYIVDKIVEVR
jgi:D-hexose-6-phosphate mutarotase